MIPILDSIAWAPEQPWSPGQDQGWSELVDGAPCCWLPPPPIACDCPAPLDFGNGATSDGPALLDLGEGGSEPALWAVGESVHTDPITGTEVEVENGWEFQPIYARMENHSVFHDVDLTFAVDLTTVAPVFTEVIPFADVAPFGEFLDGSVDAESGDPAPGEIPPPDFGDALNATELSGESLPISTKPYFFSSEEIQYLAGHPCDSAPENSAEQLEAQGHVPIEVGVEPTEVDGHSEEPILLICEPCPISLPLPLTEDSPALESIENSGDEPADEGFVYAVPEGLDDGGGESTEHSEGLHQELIEAGDELIFKDGEPVGPISDTTYEESSEHNTVVDPVSLVEVLEDERIDPCQPTDIDVHAEFVSTDPEWSAHYYYFGPGEVVHDIDVVSSYEHVDDVHSSIDSFDQAYDDSALIHGDTGSSWFIQNYSMDHMPPLSRRWVFHKADYTTEPEFFPLADPRVLRGSGEQPMAEEPENPEESMEPAGPSEDPSYIAYLEFLKENPLWVEDHGGGGIQLQVITSSAHLPWIELSTPGAAGAFDTWYSQTQLTQAPPEDQPTDPAVDLWTPELMVLPRSRTLTLEVLPGIAATADMAATTDTPLTNPVAEATTPQPSPTPSSDLITTEVAPAPAPSATGPTPATSEAAATPVPVASGEGRGLESREIPVQSPALSDIPLIPTATRPAPAPAPAVAGTTPASGADKAPATPAGEGEGDEAAGPAAGGDGVLAGEEAVLLLEPLTLTALPWWLLRPNRF